MADLKILIMPILASLSACGDVRIDSEFIPYLNKFEAEAESRGLKISAYETSVYFDNSVQGYGECTIEDFGPNKVRINKIYWDHSPDEYREPLIFHELGHCILGLDHDNSFNFEDNRPSSIMFLDTTVVGGAWAIHRKDYIDGLFDGL